MRILALVTDAYGAPGGIACYNRDLIAAIARCPEVERVVVLPRFGGAEEADVPAGVISLRPRKSKTAWGLAAAATAIGLGPFDIVYCGHLYSAPVAAGVSRLAGAMLWLQLHGIEAWRPPGWMIRFGAECAGRVTAVSRHTRKRFLSWARMAPELVSVLPNTVDERFAPGPKPLDLVGRLGLQERRVLLTVSRLSATEGYKGHETVLRALRRVRARFPDLVYVIAGDGDDRARLERLAGQLGVADATRFLGHVADDDLPALYRAADLFLMPSAGEGFGIVFLEAMASGLPVIGGSTDGSRDPLRDGLSGCMVEPGDDTELANAIAESLAAGREGKADRFVFARGHFQRMVQRIIGGFDVAATNRLPPWAERAEEIGR